MMNLTGKNELSDVIWLDICALDEITPNTGVTALIEQQQIALFRVGAEQRVYALSNQDPFSGANVMSRGILGDLQGERVVASPLYKQHFSLATGRCLEDKDHKLSVFPCKIESGRVLVHPIAKKTYITNSGVSQEKLKLVLVGNGLAGMRCIEDLMDMNADRYEITVVGEEPWGNYNRIMLSPVLSGEKTIEDIMLHPLQWYEDQKIQLIAGDPAIKIDRIKKQIFTKSGKCVEYDRLILATGSRPFIPPISGSNLQGILSFRDIHDIQSMLTYCNTDEEQVNAIVIGGGLLGLEAAYGLKQRGMQVTVLHLNDHLMDRQLDSQASQMLRHSIEEKGIRIITKAYTEALLGDEKGHVRQVRLKDGTTLKADLVVFAVGIRPNISLAQRAGLRCNRGILVDDTMQTYDPSIYAVGECIEHRGQTFGLVEPLWGQAFICASHLAERGSLAFKAPIVPTQLKVSGVDVFSAGNFQPEQDYEDIIMNDDKRQIYKRLIIQNNCLIGAVLFGDTEDGLWYSELITDQKPISAIRNKLLFGRDFALRQAS